jgi:hypothetical protein
MKANKEFIEALTNCIESCEYCATACMTEENARQMASCIKTDRDCADICSQAIQFLSRGSEFSIAVIKICKKICAKCAEECEKHDHTHCVECAKACRHCEKLCQSYLDR